MIVSALTELVAAELSAGQAYSLTIHVAKHHCIIVALRIGMCNLSYHHLPSHTYTEDFALQCFHVFIASNLLSIYIHLRLVHAPNFILRMIYEFFLSIKVT